MAATIANHFHHHNNATLLSIWKTTVNPRISNVSLRNNISHLRNFDYGTNLTDPTFLPPFGQSIEGVAISVVLGLLILLTVIGNVFVIGAILLEKHLNTINNYLVLSLAVADLFVACLVMPLGVVYEVSQEWALGPELCEMWTSVDVLCCTASILHLLAIAVDRYFAVTNVDYARQRSRRLIWTMIFLIWTVSCVVSFAPIFGWKDEDFNRRIEEEKRCLVSQDISYQIFATCSSFYLPLVVILILYWRIFQEARKRIRRRPGNQALLVVQKTKPMLTDQQPENSEVETSTESTTTNGVQAGVGRLMYLAKREKKATRETLEAKRERKAAKTLAIITGVFVICWLPFFVMALVLPMCTSCEPDPYVISIFLWLGYTNSLLNPIIYTIFSPDFRNAFRKILCGSPHTQRPF